MKALAPADHAIEDHRLDPSRQHHHDHYQQRRDPGQLEKPIKDKFTGAWSNLPCYLLRHLSS